MKRKKKKHFKFRFLIALIIFGSITTMLGYNLFNNMLTIRQMNEQKVDLKNQIADLNKEKETLESDIEKLQDPDYIARYVREKYFYSKDGELILRID